MTGDSACTIEARIEGGARDLPGQPARAAALIIARRATAIGRHPASTKTGGTRRRTPLRAPAIARSATGCCA